MAAEDQPRNLLGTLSATQSAAALGTRLKRKTQKTRIAEHQQKNDTGATRYKQERVVQVCHTVSVSLSLCATDRPLARFCCRWAHC
jgi:hypothetical protein